MGLARVKLVAALLSLDRNALDQALSEAEESFQLATESEDPIVMARARLATCMIEDYRACTAPKASPQVDASIEHALACAEEAVTLASKTQNARLQARAHTWRGLILLRASADNRREALACYRRAKKLLVPPGASYAAEELHRLSEALDPKQHSEQADVDRALKPVAVAPAGARQKRL